MNRSPEIQTTLEAKLEENLKELSQLEATINQENVQIFTEHVEDNLEQLNEIEAKMQTEAWTVTAKMDTIMLNNWLKDASKFQAEMGKRFLTKKVDALVGRRTKFNLNRL